MKREPLHAALASSEFSDLDRHFAKLMQRLAGGDHPELLLAAALVSRATSNGDICLDLARVAGTSILPTTTPSPRCPDLEPWLELLRASAVVGRPSEFKPLILDTHARLYLHRYWEYENALAITLKARAATESNDVDEALLQRGLARLFPALNAGELNWQKVAALAALRKKFCVISGGPGTGKTRTVVLLLALLLEQAGGKLRIALAAPTGKAAARLQESVKSVKVALAGDESIKAALPDAAMTVHRLFGAQPGSPYFRHDVQNPLAVDVVVVDEASMVDLPLMAKLFAAVPASARVILLGDKDQLASVQAGAVLGDICGSTVANYFSDAFGKAFTRLSGESLPHHSSTTPNPLADCVVQLQKNYRFGNDNGIQTLSRAVNNGEADAALQLLRAPGMDSGVALMALPATTHLKATLREKVLPILSASFQASEPVDALRALGRFRILCAVRRGPFGVERLNELLEEIFAEAGLIARDTLWYRGRPVLITANDYDLGLFNGDIGVVFPDAANGGPRVWFASAEATLRSVVPAQLPAHETVFAMTIHKSQGSEFEEVLLVLPDRDNPVLTRELLYTGLTRASRRVELWTEENIFRAAISRNVVRASGLQDALKSHR